jgi:hypothetical protein
MAMAPKARWTKALCSQGFVAAVALAAGLSWAAAPPEKGATSDVLPIRLPDRPPTHLDGVPDRIYRAAEKQAHYLLGTVQPWAADPTLRLMTASASGEHTIRPNTSAIAGFALLYRFGPYDEKLVGVSRAELLRETIVPMMRYCVATHATGPRPTSDGKRWGDAWQSAFWAQMLGRAAWWTWADLPDDLRSGVRRVVAHEADRFLRAEPPHQIPYDTKAEENAWNSLIFNAAILIMPGDPRRAEWEAAFQKWVLSSFLRPADAKCRTVVDGRPVAAQFAGANIYDDFTLENHGFIHPDYMTCFSLSLGAQADFLLSGRKPPEALLWNVAPIYENLKWFSLPDGGYVYPNGQDWELFRNPAWVNAHVLAAAFVRDGDAWSLLQPCLTTLEKMQARSPDGAIYGKGEYFFASTQHGLLYGLGAAWLELQLTDDVPRTPRERLGVRRLDAGKLVLHRTKTAVHSFSWGARVMAQCVPLRLDRIVSPDQRNGIGHVRLAGGKGPLPVKPGRVHVAETADGFTAELTLVHGEGQVRAELRFESRADGSLTIREELVAEKQVTTDEIATGLIGVLNNPGWIYERGRREIACDGQTSTVAALSGETLLRQGVKRLTIDDGLEIVSAGLPQVRYQAARRAERGRATDLLHLNYLPGPKTWRPGETISRWQAVVRPLGRTEPPASAGG